MRKHGLPVILIALLAGSGCAGPGRTCGERHAQGLIGAWQSRVQFERGAFAQIKDLEFLYVFNAGGTMTESSNYDGAPPVPPAYGAWRAVGPSKFETRYIFYTTKPPAKPEDLAAAGWGPAGRGELVEHIDLSADGQSFTSTITATIYDVAGEAVETGWCATGHGTRIGF